MSNDDSYFTYYEDLEVHEIMLRDRSRLEAYKRAINLNSALFKNKIVLDVGAGTGILSVFCAKAGAKRVYAVEASDSVKIALKVVEENSLQSVIKVIHCRIEELTLPKAAEKVDIIVSEWMGFYLLHEGMLDSVLFAREKFLKPNGLMFPSEATIYIAPCAIPSLFDDWEDYDGVRLTSFSEMLRQQKSSKLEVASIPAKDLLHEGLAIHSMNLMDVTPQELDKIVFQDVIAVKTAGKHQGFCIWFECKFPAESYENSIVLSTSPTSPATHWKQCVVILPSASCEELDEDAPISFKLLMQRNMENKRKYDIEVEMLDPTTVEHPVPCECYFTKCILIKAHLKTLNM